jgi:hypothetical protein
MTPAVTRTSWIPSSGVDIEEVWSTVVNDLPSTAT